MRFIALILSLQLLSSISLAQECKTLFYYTPNHERILQIFDFVQTNIPPSPPRPLAMTFANLPSIKNPIVREKVVEPLINKFHQEMVMSEFFLSRGGDYKALYQDEKKSGVKDTDNLVVNEIAVEVLSDLENFYLQSINPQSKYHFNKDLFHLLSLYLNTLKRTTLQVKDHNLRLSGVVAREKLEKRHRETRNYFYPKLAQLLRDMETYTHKEDLAYFMDFDPVTSSYKNLYEANENIDLIRYELSRLNFLQSHFQSHYAQLAAEINILFTNVTYDYHVMREGLPIATEIQYYSMARKRALFLAQYQVLFKIIAYRHADLYWDYRHTQLEIQRLKTKSDELINKNDLSEETIKVVAARKDIFDAFHHLQALRKMVD